jgi:NAD(P)-dependent dehydrogenase (short-subunit alcohol dehydrogenase family)
MGRVEGKVVVVTGAAGGQGAAEALALAAEGATVIATDLSAPALHAGGIVGRALDVTSGEAWGVLAEWLRSEHGRVDGLVNNAGISMRHRLAELTLDDFEQVMAVNVNGALLGTQAIAPLMRDGGVPAGEHRGHAARPAGPGRGRRAADRVPDLGRVVVHHRCGDRGRRRTERPRRRQGAVRRGARRGRGPCAGVIAGEP